MLTEGPTPLLHQAVLAALPGHIAVLAPGGEIVLVNQAWRRFGELNDAQILAWEGRNYLDACRDSADPEARAALRGIEEVFAGQRPRFVLEYPCHRPGGGERRWFELIALPFEVEHTRYVLIQHTPVTERRLLELELRQAQKMEAIGRLASGVAHDFNNLLMGIAGTANIGLKRVERDDPVRYYFDEIKNAAVGGAAITKQLLTFSRKSSPGPSCRNLDEVVLENEGMLRQLIGEAVDFEIRSGCEAGAVRCGDGQLIQILMNLVVNARDAMGGTGTIQISTHPVEVDAKSSLELAPGSYCVLGVSDTGTGMDQETRERIFDPFFTTKSVGKGTGLGLSTVYGVVRSAGGLIQVISEPGQGTRFEIYLPRLERADETETETDADEALAGGAETVLVVEDEALVRDAVREYLGDAGYRVLVAGDGDEARMVCRKAEGAIDMVLTDMVLPRATGDRVARDVLALAPGAQVLYMSAHPREVLLESGRIHDEDLVLAKPFGERELLQAVRQCFADGAAARSRKVLVVDDDRSGRAALVELIGDEELEVCEAGSGGEALELALATPGGFGVIVTDFTLPDFTGAALIERLAAEGPLPPVIYLSGRSPDEPEVAQALRRARTRFIQKPVDFDDILAAIDEALGCYSPAR